MYCTESCKQQHKGLFHGKFCSKPPKNTMLDDEVSLRIIQIANEELGSSDELLNLLNNPKKLTIFDFDKLSRKNILAIFCSLAQTEYQKTRCSKICEKQVFNQVAAIRCTNAMSFDEVYSDDGRIIKGKSTGVTVCLFVSLFNHSCDENVSWMTFDNKIVFYVYRPIKAGEQLFVNYGVSFSARTLKKRQNYLKEYDINCDCDACTNDYPLWADLPKLHKMHEIPVDKKSNETSIDELVEIFKGTCKFINRYHNGHPCSETEAAMGQLRSVINQISRITI